MYNINYRDERTPDRPDINFQAWASLSAQNHPLHQLRPSLPQPQQSPHHHHHQQQQQQPKQPKQTQSQQHSVRQQQQHPIQQQQQQQHGSTPTQPIPQQVVHQSFAGGLSLHHQQALRAGQQQQSLQQQQHSQQPSVPVRERLWVEISDDEDSSLCPPPVFKTSGKSTSQPTPPLDLTVMERTTKQRGSRPGESPLDLSVKATRKRPAEPVDFAEYAQGRGHVSDVSVVKRMYMTSHNASPPQGISREIHMANLIQAEQLQQQKQYGLSEPMAKSKYSLKPSSSSKTLPRRPSPQSNPRATTQKQYASIQRQHQIQQLQHQQQQQQLRPHEQHHQQHQRGVRQMTVSPGQFQGSQDGLRPSPHQLRTQHSPYPSLSACHSSATPSPQSSSSETVALQGFFEPTQTQSLTVNPGLTRPASYRTGTPTATRAEQPAYGASHSPMMHSSIGRSRELVSTMDDMRRHIASSATHFTPHSPSSATVPNVRKEMVAMHPPGNATNIAQLELLQQQQLQRQKHLQIQRDQGAALAGVPQPPCTNVGGGSRGFRPERVDGASNAYDFHHKRQEPAIGLSKAPYPSTQEQISPYSSQKLQQHKYMSSNSSHPAINQDERNMYVGSYYGSVSQPVSSELAKQSAVIADKTRLSRSRNESSFGHMDCKPESSSLTYFQSKSQSLINQSVMMDARQAARLEILEHEQRYRNSLSGSLERQQYHDRLDHVAVPRRDLHPSVIQKPQGFIPPRIVSGGGRSASVTMGNSEQNKSVPETMQRRYSLDTMRPLDTREQSSLVNNAYRRKSSESTSQRSLSRETNQGLIPVRDESSMNERSLSSVQRHRGPSSSMPAYNKRDLSHSTQQQNQSKLHFSQRGIPTPGRGDEFQRSGGSRDVPGGKRASKAFSADQGQGRKDAATHRDAQVNRDMRKDSETVIMSALSGVMIPHLMRKPSERSITKGTSGLQRDIPATELIGHLINREIKKADEVSRVNPFANRSILQEYDRSRNTPTPSKTDTGTCETVCIPKQSGQNTREVEMSTDAPDPSYDLPLQIAIPGSKVATTPASQECESGSASVAPATTKQGNNNRPKSPTKILSRKQMILMAFKQEEDLKNTVNIDKDQKIPMESHKFASSKKSERETSSLSNLPPSPKMPILSPQERNRTTTGASSSGAGDPPNLEATPQSSGNGSSTLCPNTNKTNSDMNSFEEHLHRLISDAVKGSVNKDKDSVYETVCRELTTQPPGKVFITRQLSQNKNIPVANVAPIVHGRNMNESGNARPAESKAKISIELDEEDEKLAAVVTRSLFESSFGLMGEKSGKCDETKNKDALGKTKIKLEQEQTNITVAHSVFETDPKSTLGESMFNEDSNSMKRMSPGLKKLMLYRHRDITENSRDCATPATDSDQSLSQMSDVKSVIPEQTAAPVKDAGKEGEAERNVFGTFNEILAQNCGGKTDTEFNRASWSEVKMEDEELHIQMVPNTDYDGDDEDMKDQKKLPRRSRKSSVKQQADRLIKKARDRRKSEGMCRAQFHKQRPIKGFVDFTPQVLPHRTRIRLKGKSPTRRCRGTKRETISNPVKQSKKSEVKGSTLGKSRQRRSSSLDRDTKKKRSTKKGKQICYSDIEVDNAISHVGDDVTGENWHDESTDEDYFRSYQEELKQNETGSLCGEEGEEEEEEEAEPVNAPPAKKIGANKKRKGFLFKQKYIFQRKRKTKNKLKGLVNALSGTAGNLETNLNHQEEIQSYSPIPFGSSEIGFYDNIPIPPDVKRLSVNKDTGETLLHRAARMGHEEVALYCLATGTVDVNARDNAGYTALHECCVRGHQDIARILLMHGADVNCCSVDGIRPIHDAVEVDQIEMVRLLLSFGGDPTLSTYAGRSLLKIARSERMKRFLHQYHSDLNGYESESDEKPWPFAASSTILESEENKGCPIFAELPSDPEEELDDLCTLSAKPLFVNRRLAPEHGKRVEDYVLLQDILNSYNVTKRDFESIGISPHLVKRLSVRNLQDSLTDSIFLESFVHNEDQATVPALRAVDTTQLVVKLEKFVQSASKRSKS